MSKNKSCTGCKGIENYCSIPHEICPCVKCLIKNMCENDCPKYYQYVVIIQNLDSDGKIRICRVGWKSNTTTARTFLVKIKDLELIKSEALKQQRECEE